MKARVVFSPALNKYLACSNETSMLGSVSDESAVTTDADQFMTGSRSGGGWMYELFQRRKGYLQGRHRHARDAYKKATVCMTLKRQVERKEAWESCGRLLVLLSFSVISFGYDASRRSRGDQGLGPLSASSPERCFSKTGRKSITNINSSREQVFFSIRSDSRRRINTLPHILQESGFCQHKLWRFAAAQSAAAKGSYCSCNPRQFECDALRKKGRFIASESLRKL